MLMTLGVLVGAGFATSNTSPAQQTSTPIKVGPSGLPIPRFVSLKADRVNVRRGPSKDHDIAWVFARQGLPVEIIAEYDNWRQVRDSDGEEGWVFYSLLSGRRTAIIAPWAKEKVLPLRATAREAGDVLAQVEPGVLARLEQCDSTWCRISIGAAAGWMPQDMLWGVYPGEKID